MITATSTNQSCHFLRSLMRPKQAPLTFSMRPKSFGRVVYMVYMSVGFLNIARVLIGNPK